MSIRNDHTAPAVERVHSPPIEGRSRLFSWLGRPRGFWFLGGGLLIVVVIAVVVVALTGGGEDEPDAVAAATSAPSSTSPSVTTGAAVAPAVTTIEEGEDPPGEPTAQGIVAGAIEQDGVIGAPPERPEVVPEPPDWEPVALELVEEPDEEAFIEPDPVAVPYFSSGVIDDFTSNAVGCASNCITKALLHPQLLTADLGFEVETNVAATLTVWVGTNPIFIFNDAPGMLDPVATADSGAPVTEWQTEIEPLEFSTTYNVILRATDQYGNSRYATTEYTTVDSPTPGQLVGNGGGCYYQCIVSGEVFPTDAYHTVRLVVTTTVVADFHIAVSRQEPGFVGDSPLLPQDEPFIVEQDSGTAIGGYVEELSPDTTYHVVVKATDADGFTAHAVGEFHTAAVPRVPPSPTDVYIQFERFIVVQDGDVGPNRGEIEFTWGFEDLSYIAHRNFDKISSGETVVLSDAGTWISVEPGGHLPNMIVNATEWDNDLSGLCGGATGLVTWAQDDPGCDTNTNVALTGLLPLTFIDDLLPCSSYFTVAFGEDRPCLEISSQDLGGSWVEFRAIISFETG